MATLTVEDDRLRIELTRFEHIAGLLRDVDIPLSAIRSVRQIGEPLAATRGMRAPGLGVPRRLKIGTWRGGGTKQYVVARHGESGLWIELAANPDTDYDEIILSLEGSERVAESIEARRADAV